MIESTPASQIIVTPISVRGSGAQNNEIPGHAGDDTKERPGMT